MKRVWPYIVFVGLYGGLAWFVEVLFDVETAVVACSGLAALWLFFWWLSTKGD